jgi:hypothetical protein
MKLSEIQLVSEIQALFAENNEYDAIKADIAERGIQDPVKVNKHNQLLAGYTRIKIAQELGLDEVPHIVVNIDGDMDAMMEYAILDNIRRRQLTDLQLVEYGVKLEKLYDGRQGRPEKGGQNDHVFEGKTRDLVAAQLSEQTGAKMSGKKYERLKTIATKAIPEVRQKYNEGALTQAQALELAKLPSEVQTELQNGAPPYFPEDTSNFSAIVSWAEQRRLYLDIYPPPAGLERRNAYAIVDIGLQWGAGGVINQIKRRYGEKCLNVIIKHPVKFVLICGAMLRNIKEVHTDEGELYGVVDLYGAVVDLHDALEYPWAAKVLEEAGWLRQTSDGVEVLHEPTDCEIVDLGTDLYLILTTPGLH